METFLGCKGINQIFETVKKCWASLFGFKAIEYRRQNGQVINIGMCVVVQEMVAAEAAGVMFTRDPRTGSPQTMSIASNHGLGESVVSAAADPDDITVGRAHDGALTCEKYCYGQKSNESSDESSISCIHRLKICGGSVYLKPVNIISESEGIETVANELADKQCSITNEQILILAQIGVYVNPGGWIDSNRNYRAYLRAVAKTSFCILHSGVLVNSSGFQAESLRSSWRLRIFIDCFFNSLINGDLPKWVMVEKKYGDARDIEWAMSNGKPYLLQSRPITSLYQMTDSEYINEYNTPLFSDNDMISSGNVKEVLPGALSPLWNTYFDECFVVGLDLYYISLIAIVEYFSETRWLIFTRSKTELAPHSKRYSLRGPREPISDGEWCNSSNKRPFFMEYRWKYRAIIDLMIENEMGYQINDKYRTVEAENISNGFDIALNGRVIDDVGAEEFGIQRHGYIDGYFRWENYFGFMKVENSLKLDACVTSIFVKAKKKKKAEFPVTVLTDGRVECFKPTHITFDNNDRMYNQHTLLLTGHRVMKYMKNKFENLDLDYEYYTDMEELSDKTRAILVSDYRHRKPELLNVAHNEFIFLLYILQTLRFSSLAQKESILKSILINKFIFEATCRLCDKQNIKFVPVAYIPYPLYIQYLICVLQKLANAIRQATGKEKFTSMSKEEAVKWLTSNNSPVKNDYDEFIFRHGHRCIKEVYYNISRIYATSFGAISFFTSWDHCCSGATLKFAYMLQVFSFPFFTVKTNVAFEQQFGKPGNFDPISKPWCMDPSKLIAPLCATLNNDNVKYKKKLTIDEALKNLKTPLTSKQKKKLRDTVLKARQFVAYREQAKSLLIRTCHEMRKGFIRLGELMVLDGRLPDAELVMFMSHSEIKTLTYNRSAAIIQNGVDSTLINFTLPGGVESTPVVELIQLLENNSTPVSRGIVEATARVVQDVEDAGCIKNGDILVTTSTDIAWSPYFSILSGVITEIGGLVSHEKQIKKQILDDLPLGARGTIVGFRETTKDTSIGTANKELEKVTLGSDLGYDSTTMGSTPVRGAVVAREYGIPCVVGVTGATDSLKSGDMIRLNGNTGAIERLDS
ncbi:putative phosphoenolpyruvate synthase [Nymphon striatum]|nr:putative phosphoenolpyruvate synthase [Nymphon striatum]